VNVDNSSYLEWPGQKEDEKFLITHANTDPDFIRTTGLSLVSGANFSNQLTNDTANYILNESAVKKLGLSVQSVLGKELIFWGNKGKVIGVVKDFHFKPLNTGIEPFILRYQPEDRYFRILVKTAAGRTREALDHIQASYAKFDQDGPAIFSFVSELVEMQYKKDRLVTGLIMLFSMLAILIACLGIFGLTAYTVEQRVKEIGIRKVLGASVSSIVGIFVKEQMRVVSVGALVAVPISIYVVRTWLENYAYRIAIDWTLFLASCIAVVSIAALTVGLMTFGAAKAKPVNSLRSE
jgi:ABC-type antimicrobial peptide transport system permease subunit